MAKVKPKKVQRFKAHSPPIAMTEVYDLRRYCELVTRTSGVGLRFVAGAETAYTDGKTIFIPVLNSKTTERDAYRLGAYVVHEAAHHRHGREHFEILKSNPMTMESPLRAISNMIEDSRINRATNEEFRGDGIRLSDGSYYCGMEVYDKYSEYRKKLKPGETLWDNKTEPLGSVQMAQIESDGDWNRGSVLGFTPVFEEFFTDDMHKKKDGLVTDLDFVNVTRTLKNSQEAWEFSKKVYEYLYDDSAEEHLAEQKQACGGEGADGEPKDGGGDKSDGPDGDKQSKEKGEAGFTKGKGAIKVTDLVTSEHNEEWGGPGGTGMGYDYSEYNPGAGGTWAPWPEVVKPIDYTRGESVNKTAYRRGAPEFNSWSKGISRSEMAEAGFSNQVRRLLQVRTAARYEHNHKHGRLHNRSVYRVAMPAINDGDWNSRIFKKRKVDDVLKANVLVLVDWSGSMAGDKAVHAAEAAVLINEVFSRVLKIPLEIVSHAFTDKPNYGIIKPFDSPATSDQIRDRFADFTGVMSGNDDHDALLFAYQRLLDRKTKRRVLIALSDGAPADGYEYSDVYNALAQTCKTIEASKVVELYGLGILDKNVERFYKKHSVLKNVNELEKTLLELLNKIIITE